MQQPEPSQTLSELPARIRAKIAPADSGCWEWTGYCCVKGYGKVYSTRGTLAHRVVYEALKGQIAPGLQLDHLCRNRKCVNPCHLEEVTAKVNSNRGISTEINAERQMRKTACPSGHEYSGSNLYITPSGYRRCRACRRESMRIYE